jgi:16S rRNA (guanine527-N7)-methyltransferase
LSRLTRTVRFTLPPEAGERLWLHYEELRRWNPTLSLIGPGTSEDVVERHYGEAIAGLELIEAAGKTLVDVGSGAGFPGFVLAACRADLEVTLVESNARKWAFLQAACRRAALSVRCLNARVAIPLAEGLPATMDLLTARALKLDAIVRALEPRLGPGARILFWAGGDPFTAPRGWQISRQRALAGSARRRIVELERA